MRFHAADPPALVLDRSRGRFEVTGDHVEGSGLARAVGTDDAQALTLLYGESVVIDRHHAAELLAQIFHFQESSPFFPPWILSLYLIPEL